MASTQQTSVARRQLIAAGVLPPRLTPLMRELRSAVTAMTDDVRTELAHPQAAYNAADPHRSCPTDGVARLVDEALDALRALPREAMSAEQKLEQGLALSRAIEAHVRAKLAPAPAMSPTEHGLRVSRTDAAEDVTLAEHLAHPNDPAIAIRAAQMAEREAHEKLGWAARTRAFFQLRPRGSVA